MRTRVKWDDVYSDTGGACLSSQAYRPPCWRESCRYHLSSGARWRVRPRVSPVPDTCVLRLSQRHRTLEEVAELLGCTRERVRQIEVVALRKLSVMARERGWSQ